MTSRYPFEVSGRRRPRPTLLSVGKWVVLSVCLTVTGVLILLQLAGAHLP